MDALSAILKDALTLKPAQKAQLIDKLLLSLNKPDETMDELWAEEVEDRIDAHDQGKLKAIPLEKILEKYR